MLIFNFSIFFNINCKISGTQNNICLKLSPNSTHAGFFYTRHQRKLDIRVFGQSEYVKNLYQLDDH